MKSKKKPILWAVLAVLLVVLALGGIKAAQIGAMIAAGESYVPPAQAVTTFDVLEVTWTSELTAVGSVVPVQGVTVATEVPGTVTKIAFESGQMVKEGDLLVRLDTSIEQAQLASAQSSARLAQAELARRKNLPPAGAVSQADLDASAASATQAQSNVANVRAVIAKKTIRAPFSGRLGIRQINLGQVLQPGSPIVSLQSSDPIYVDFALPQQALSSIAPGHVVSIRTDAFPDTEWRGTVEVIDAEIDTRTRNFMARAVVPNEDEKLRTGMFVDVTVLRPESEDLLAIPASAVLFAPYGDSVYVVNAEADDSGEEALVVEQAFVRLGARRGDLVAVSSGVEAGDVVVSTGAFKLQNGMRVTVRDDLEPEVSVAPSPPNE